MSVRILTGDCRALLRTLEADSVHCVVTSPPYWGLRDYGVEPSVWDGDPSCSHQWGPLERKANANAIQGPASGGKNVDYAGFDREKYTGPFCTECDAWRGALGLEPTLGLFVEHIVEIFAEVRRVLRADGTLWLNMGDSYASSPNGRSAADTKAAGNDDRTFRDKPFSTIGPIYDPNGGAKGGGFRGDNGGRDGSASDMVPQGRIVAGGFLKPKDLCGIPWRLAFALQADGWYLRRDIIWHKLNPMPESVRDRPTTAHEYLFLLTKNERYYYDADAIRTPFSDETKSLSFETMDFKKRDQYKKPDGWNSGKGAHGSFHRDGREKGQKAPAEYVPPDGANKRSVWPLATEAFSEAHFATFPTSLVEPCILAGSPVGGLVLDPFGGAGTTGLVADRLRRDAVLIELNPAYVEIARNRIFGDAPLFVEVAAE